MESELFGHEKGSFTGADSKRIGKFEQSSGGTLFLDEIGDMTPLVQSKVLRLLQEQRFERVGGNETIQTDVRIIAATNCNLEQMVADGLFRADLYYRLNGFTIELPPMRERRDDIMVLLEHFLQRFSRELGKDVHVISPEALELLTRYGWPGNVRELQSVLKQALLHATGSVLVPEFLPEQIKAAKSSSASDDKSDPQHADAWEKFVAHRLQIGSEDLYAESLNLMEKYLIARVLQHTAGNQSQAAKILGITRGCLRNKIRALGISIGQVVSVDHEPLDDDDSHAPAYSGSARARRQRASRPRFAATSCRRSPISGALSRSKTVVAEPSPRPAPTPAVETLPARRRFVHRAPSAPAPKPIGWPGAHRNCSPAP